MATVATPAMTQFAADWEHAIDSAAKRNDAATQSGIVGDKAHRARGGYHISREDQPSSNYSVSEYAIDRQGPSNAAAAVDMSMRDEQMRQVSGRLLSAARNRDPRVMYARAFNGTTDSKKAIRVEITDFGIGTASSDHLWHVHLEIHRAWVTNTDVMRALLSVITGQSLAAYKAAGGKLPSLAVPALTPLASSDTTALMRALPAVAQGSKDQTHVKRVQALLAIFGHRLDIDGDFGPATRAAVVDFQKTVPATGTVGPIDWAFLVRAGKTTPMIRVKYGDQGAAVKRLQALLAVFGHHLELDGDFGPATRAAFAAWTHTVGRPSDGQVDAFDWSLLLHGRNVLS